MVSATVVSRSEMDGVYARSAVIVLLKEELSERHMTAKDFGEQAGCAETWAEAVLSGCKRLTRKDVKSISLVFDTSQIMWRRLAKLAEDRSKDV